MKIRFKSKAPPGGIFRLWPGIVLSLVLMLPISAHSQHEFAKTADLPDWHVQLWEQVIRQDIWFFGQYMAPLGDINSDGFDDFAVSSGADTTFIFLGGDPFNHHEAFIVRGGSSGIASEDFNGDGKMDLVTAIQNWWPGEEPTDYRGAVRVYLQKSPPEYFRWEPDLLIEGEVNALLGKKISSGFRGSVRSLDFNGDGFGDFLTNTKDARDSATWKAVLFLGGPGLDGIADAEFRVGIPQSKSHGYIRDILIGDINGDSYDDVLVCGRLPGIDYWDVFLGNRWAIAHDPQRTLFADKGWAPQLSLAAMMDVDGDGFDDILDAGAESLHRPLGDALLFRGKAILPEIILPDDSIPNLNPDPMLDISPQIVSPVGDMNGDGTPDLVLAWNKALAPGGSAYYFYPGGLQFRTPLGYFGTLPENDNVAAGVYPAGDVNGDGYEDIITLGKGTKNLSTCRFQIWLGAKQLRTSTYQTPILQPLTVALAPNPLPANARHLHISVHGLRAGAVEVLVTDLLGRTRLCQSLDAMSENLEQTLDLAELPVGVYLLSLLQNYNTVTRTFVKY